MKLLLKPLVLAIIVANASDAQGLRGEWFIDADPGPSQAISFEFDPGVSAETTVAIPPDVMRALAPGFHLVGLRVMDGSGQWGHTVWSGFHIVASAQPDFRLAGGEWISVAEGEEGITGPIATGLAGGGETIVEVGAPLVRTFAKGFRWIGVRMKDTTGRWSHIAWGGTHVDPLLGDERFLSRLQYRVLRGEDVTGGATREYTGATVVQDDLIDHGKDGLFLSERQVLEVVPIDQHGVRGHSIYGSFLVERYAQVWKQRYFSPADLSDSEISGDAADPDGDGLTNGEELLYSLNPKSTEDGGKGSPLVTLNEAEGRFLFSLRIPGGGNRDADAVYRTSDIVVRLQQSADLTAWTEVPAAKINVWRLEDIGNGAAILTMELSKEVGGVVFFRALVQRSQ